MEKMERRYPAVPVPYAQPIQAYNEPVRDFRTNNNKNARVDEWVNEHLSFAGSQGVAEYESSFDQGSERFEPQGVIDRVGISSSSLTPGLNCSNFLLGFL